MKIAFITNPSVQCGVAQYGLSIIAALQDFSRHTVTSYHLADKQDFEAAQKDIAAADLALYNYHPNTLGFLGKADIRSTRKPAVGLLHEFDYVTAYTELADLFRYRVVSDPSLASRLPGLWSVPRIVPQIPVAAPANDIFTIGTFGFATHGKNYDEIIRFTARHFQRARIRLHIPNSFYCDKDGRHVRQVMEDCRKLADDRIDLEFSGEFLSEEALVKFLAANDLNVFLYDDQPGRGISSVLDFAVAAERPLALSKSTMFRHVRAFAPELFLDISPLERILAEGTASCQRLKALWTPEKAAKAFDEILEAAFDDFNRPHIHRVNTILTDDFREALHPREEEMKELCPAFFSHKISRANVQQAFVLEQVEKYAKVGDAILCVEYNKDIAYYTLKEKGYVVDAIDPGSDMGLNGFFQQFHGRRYYKCIFSTSIMEHIADDEKFISQISQLLAPGGVAILTMDFQELYQPGDTIQSADERFHITNRFLGKFVPLLHGCKLLDVPDWNAYKADFNYDGYCYSFATMVFHKNINLYEKITSNYEQHVRMYEKVDKFQFNEYNLKYILTLTENEHLRQERNQIINSLSWRITRPFRYIKNSIHNSHKVIRRLKEKIRTMPGAHALRTVYRNLRTRWKAFHDFNRQMKKFIGYFDKLRFRNVPVKEKDDEHTVTVMLKNKMNSISFGKRLRSKDEN